MSFRAPRSSPLPDRVASEACRRRDKRRATADLGSGAKSGRYDGTSGDLPVPVVTGERIGKFAQGSERRAQRPSGSCKKPTLFWGEFGEKLLVTPPSGNRRAKKLLMIGQDFSPQLVGDILYAAPSRLGIGQPAVLCSNNSRRRGREFTTRRSRNR
jgi:hypothetical protein